MNTKFTVWNGFLWTAIVLMMLSNSVFAADECPSDIKAVTNEDATVLVDVLAHHVKPLTKCELEAEAQAWLLLLKEKVEEISNAEVAAIYKKQEIEKAEEVEKALEEVKEAKEEVEEAANEAQQDDHSEAKEDVSEAVDEAKEALKESSEAEQKLAQDKELQEAVKSATSKAKEEGEEISASDESTEAKEDVKTALVKYVTNLMAERTSLIDRFNVVLAELATKGGETEEYDTYIKLIQSIKVTKQLQLTGN